MITFLEPFLFQSNVEISSNAAWAYSNITNSPNVSLDKVVSEFLIKQTLVLIEKPDLVVKVATIRIIGNIFSAENAKPYMAEYIKLGLLKKLTGLLDHRRPGIRRETLWVISNLMAEDENILGKILEETNLMQKVIHLLSYDIDDVKLIKLEFNLPRSDMKPASAL
jgi:importin subunit alpha-1